MVGEMRAGDDWVRGMWCLMVREMVDQALKEGSSGSDAGLVRHLVLHALYVQPNTDL